AVDTLATDKPLTLIKTGTPAVKRQSATALGQIKDIKSVPVLLEALENIDDRFIQHAIIYSLVAHKSPTLLLQGLLNNSSKIQEASLIALDQLSGNLKPYHLTPFLKKENLQRTALWIASHHPEWSGSLITFLRDAFSKKSSFEEKNKLYRNILISFSDQVNMQWFFIELLQNASPERKLFVLNLMKDCPLKELPLFWQQSIGHILNGSEDLPVLLQAIALVRQYEIKSLEPYLQRLITIEPSSPELTLNVLAALSDFNKELSEVHFEYVLSQLTAGTNILLKQKAARLLGSMTLNDIQISKMVEEFLPVTEDYTLTLILPTFKGAHSVETGRALISALSKTTLLGNFKEDELAKLFEQYPLELNPEIDGLLAMVREARSNRFSNMKELEESITYGNLDNGRQLFFNKAACSGCHTIGGEGDSFGPDLTSIQLDRSFHDLLEAIVYPDASIVREFDTFSIKTSNNTYTGIIQEQTPELIVLGLAPGISVNIDKSEIISMEVLQTSLMPQGLDKKLSKQEMADLMAFLIGQDQHPDTDHKILR
ncbi:MAG: c-type cytochrome, partial [Cyclobacteriaceae bacterium]|nr:c-type cytochrome [Cyclobacteriaceae bacterium]